MIGIICYGAGNLRSVHNAFRWLKADVQLLDQPRDLAKVCAAVLPGVGAFGPAMAQLEATGFAATLRNWTKAGKPLLGICLGMQLLGMSSDEHGEHTGLGIVDGKVTRMRALPGVQIPHIGWNIVNKVRDGKLWGELKQVTCYHAHSYRLEFGDVDARSSWTIGEAEHGDRFPSIIERGNVMGVQFHPEKSQHDGLTILENFLSYVASC